MFLGFWVCRVDVGWVGAVAVVVRTIPGDSVVVLGGCGQLILFWGSMGCVWAPCRLAARLCAWVALGFGVENRHVGFMLTLVCAVDGLRGEERFGFCYPTAHIFNI